VDDEAMVERETTIEASPAEVWEALTDEGILSDWFAEDAELDLVEGGAVRFDCDDGERSGTIEEIAEEERLSFVWTRPEYGTSRVEFSIEATPLGTRVVVTERVLVSTEASGTATATAGWWRAKLGALRATLALVPA
jgi:uncharacterized protein YndB with AHSA1/START domain